MQTADRHERGKGEALKRRQSSITVVGDNAMRISWVRDTDRKCCIACSAVFGVFRRRHHCRSCGDVFCATCSDYWLPLKGSRGTDVRLCVDCFFLVSEESNRRHMETVGEVTPVTQRGRLEPMKSPTYSPNQHGYVRNAQNVTISPVATAIGFDEDTTLDAAHGLATPSTPVPEDGVASRSHRLQSVANKGAIQLMTDAKAKSRREVFGVAVAAMLFHGFIVGSAGATSGEIIQELFGVVASEETMFWAVNVFAASTLALVVSAIIRRPVTVAVPNEKRAGNVDHAETESKGNPHKTHKKHKKHKHKHKQEASADADDHGAESKPESVPNPLEGGDDTSETPAETPAEAPEESIVEEPVLSSEDQQLVELGDSCVETVCDWTGSYDGWHKEKEEQGITVYSKKIKGCKNKVFKSDAIIDCNPQTLFDIFYDLEDQPRWNKKVLKYLTLRKLTSTHDITMTLAAPLGPVSSRDFINVRVGKQVNKGTWVICGEGVLCEDKKHPPMKNVIRGYNGSGGWVLRAVEGEPNKTAFSMIMNSDLKGWLPTKLIELTLSTVLIDFNTLARERAAEELSK